MKATTILKLEDPKTLVIHGDGRDVLRSMHPCKEPGHPPFGPIDLFFTDPPFNIGYGYKELKDTVDGFQYLNQLVEIMCGGLWVLRDGGTMVLNVSCEVAFNVYPFIMGMTTTFDVTFRHDCIWHYRFGQCHTGGFISSHVHCLVFVKGDMDKRTWNPDAIMVPSDRATKYHDKRTVNKKDGTPDGMRVPLDVFEFSRIQGNNKERHNPDIHPNQLPEAYVERIIKAFTHPGDIVLDTYAGSGTIGCVARALGRRSINVEVGQDTAASCAARIKAGPINVKV